ncbi:hypothetical protein V499_05584 [Pseudogymnoascus sp. VKM F-103]|nr:hypothetical protein V499_05584 [Pseudogymnoascus sp. VKM F-103]
MSDKDANNFVQNVGYGFSSGLLFRQNVQVPDNALEAWSTSDTGGVTERISMGARNSSSSSSINFGNVAGKQINPITEANSRDGGTMGGPKDDEGGEGEGEADGYIRRNNDKIKAENKMRDMQEEGRFESLGMIIRAEKQCWINNLASDVYSGVA